MTNSNEFKLKTEILEQSDIETIKRIITRYFRVYDTRWSERMAAFYFSMDMDTDKLERAFEDLRIDLKSLGFIPRLARESGEHIIYVVQGPKIKKRNIWINILLIIATLFTTTWAGAILWYGRTVVVENDFDIISPLLNAEVVLFGFLSFALPLMLILGTHETAHYLAAKRHKIDASLPYFIPLPPPFILGTMGAFISMREPISNKKALLDIGAAGPIAGFLVSLPVVVIGFILEGMQPVTLSELPSNVYIFNEPLLFSGLRMFFPGSENSIMHPTAFAGWVGLFVTALNLLPGGQLDGGHIARALFGSSARYLSLFVIVILFVLSFITAFMLWIIFAFIILLLGTSHPPPLNDLTPLGPKRQVIGAFCMVMLLLCIHYAPIIPLEIPDFELEFECDNCDQVVDIDSTAFYVIKVSNSADEDGLIKFNNESLSSNSNITDWKTEIKLTRPNGNIITNTESFELKSKDSFIIQANITSPDNSKYGDIIFHKLNVTITNTDKFAKKTETITLRTHVGTFDLNTSQVNDVVVESQNRKTCEFDIFVRNLIDANDTINFTFKNSDTINWSAELSTHSIQLGPKGTANGTAMITLSITKLPGVKVGSEVEVEVLGYSKLNLSAFDSIKLFVKVTKPK